MWFNNCQLESDNHFSQSTSSASATKGPGCCWNFQCQGTPLSYTQPTVLEGSQILCHRPDPQPVSPQPVLTECPHLWAGVGQHGLPEWHNVNRRQGQSGEIRMRCRKCFASSDTDAVTGRRCKDILTWHQFTAPKLHIWNTFCFGENLEHLSGILHAFLSILWCRQECIRIHI